MPRRDEERSECGLNADTLREPGAREQPGFRVEPGRLGQKQSLSPSSRVLLCSQSSGQGPAQRGSSAEDMPFSEFKETLIRLKKKKSV